MKTLYDAWEPRPQSGTIIPFPEVSLKHHAFGRVLRARVEMLYARHEQATDLQNVIRYRDAADELAAAEANYLDVLGSDA